MWRNGISLQERKGNIAQRGTQLGLSLPRDSFLLTGTFGGNVSSDTEGFSVNLDEAVPVSLNVLSDLRQTSLDFVSDFSVDCCAINRLGET
jgi:hypothetical protein